MTPPPDPGPVGERAGDEPLGEPLSGSAAAGALVRMLSDAGLTVAVAESVTGGTVTAAIVSVPGASACLRGGVVAYAEDLKAELLDVPTGLLAQHGTVHQEVARAMAAGVRARLGADYGLATTGVAGPGPQEGHAAGTFHVAVEGPSGSEVLSVVPEPGTEPSRTATRQAARDAALALALSQVGNDLATGE